MAKKRKKQRIETIPPGEYKATFEDIRLDPKTLSVTVTGVKIIERIK